MAQKPAVETAWQLLAQGKRDQAVTLLRDLIHADPRNADARLLLGSVLMESGERSESIAQLSEAVRLLPKSAEAHNALGEAYNAFGETSAARPEFERAVELDPRHAQAHVNLAAILLQQGETARAVPHLDEAIRLFGHRADAAEPHYLRAKVYSEERDFGKAVPNCSRPWNCAPTLPRRGATWEMHARTCPTARALCPLSAVPSR